MCYNNMVWNLRHRIHALKNEGTIVTRAKHGRIHQHGDPNNMNTMAASNMRSL